MFYRCPVCGYSRLPEPPVNFSICPSCGTEFGYDDAQKAHSLLRKEWADSDAPWFSRARPAPAGWNGWVQLIEAGFGYALPFRAYLRLRASSISSGRPASASPTQHYYMNVK
jgi:hypothetical protein